MMKKQHPHPKHFWDDVAFVASLATKQQIAQTKRREDKRDMLEEAVQKDEAEAKVVVAIVEAIWAAEAKFQVKIKGEILVLKETK